MYPKTSRIGNKMGDILITEKLDESNLSIFKLNGELYIGQRNYILSLRVCQISLVHFFL